MLNGLYAADLSMCILLRGQTLGALLGRAGCTQPTRTLEEAGAAVVGCCHAGRVPLNGAALLSLAAPRDSLWLLVVRIFVCLLHRMFVWLVGWLVGWLLFGLFVCLFVCLLACLLVCFA